MTIAAHAAAERRDSDIVPAPTAPRRQRPRKLFDGELVRRAIADAVRKLDPRHMVRNPVMFVVLIVGALTFVPALALGPVVEHLALAGGGS